MVTVLSAQLVAQRIRQQGNYGHFSAGAVGRSEIHVKLQDIAEWKAT